MTSSPEMMLSSPEPAPDLYVPTKWSSLYVDNLDPKVTEEDLAAAFAPFGNVAVRVCRHRSSGESCCYGFVNFLSYSHAESAMMAMNRVELNGQPMRVMWSRGNPRWSMDGVGNIFVKNFGDMLREAELKQLFGKYGRVESCRLVVDTNGLSKGFGFIRMDSEESAQSAIKALHGALILGSTKRLHVSKFVNRHAKQASNSTNLHIKNLNEHVTNRILREKFSVFGDVTSAVVMRDAYGRSRHFGFVNFMLSGCAEKAMKAMNGSKIGPTYVYVSWARKRAKPDESLTTEEGSTVCVRNLEKSVHEYSLLNIFLGCGKVLWARVMRDQNGLSKGCGFVCFSSAAEANLAAKRFNGISYAGKYLHVTVEPKRRNDLKGLNHQPVYPKLVQPSQITYYSLPQHCNWFQVPMNVKPQNLLQYSGVGCFTGNQGFQVYLPPSMKMAYAWPVYKTSNGMKVSELYSASKGPSQIVYNGGWVCP